MHRELGVPLCGHDCCRLTKFDHLFVMALIRHRWTGRYEAHLWDNSCRREGQTRKGRQGTDMTSLNLFFFCYQYFL